MSTEGPYPDGTLMDTLNFLAGCCSVRRVSKALEVPDGSETLHKRLVQAADALRWYVMNRTNADDRTTTLIDAQLIELSLARTSPRVAECARAVLLTFGFPAVVLDECAGVPDRGEVPSGWEAFPWSYLEALRQEHVDGAPVVVVTSAEGTEHAYAAPGFQNPDRPVQ